MNRLISITCDHAPLATLASETAQKLGCSVSELPRDSIVTTGSLPTSSQSIDPLTMTTDYHLSFSSDGVSLHNNKKGKQNPIQVNFHSGSADHRRKYGGGKSQMIAKAVGITSTYKPKILDGTAGLGGDAFVLASLGAQVILQERSPIAYALLADGLARAIAYAQDHEDNELHTILKRMHLHQADSVLTPTNNIEVIYLDPMFPERKKSAAVNKSMSSFHDLIGSDEDADQLLAHALNQTIKRVAVKRPRHAPPLLEKKPSYSLEGKSSRFDIYAIQKLTG